MPRYRFIVEYLGIDYHGWQKQPNQITVQQSLEEAFSTCSRETIKIMGSGRTDAGVSALGQVAHFDSNRELEVELIQRSVNALTGKGLYIRELKLCALDFNSRFAACARYYQYRISFRPRALEQNQTWFVFEPLNLTLFKEELKRVVGTHDFDSLSISRKDGRSTVCTITRAELEDRGDGVIIHIEGNRFLHKMVRSLIGVSYDVARGYSLPGLMDRIMSQQFKGERTWAPAQGLCLRKVKYPE